MELPKGSYNESVKNDLDEKAKILDKLFVDVAPMVVKVNAKFDVVKDGPFIDPISESKAKI
eukprot:199203-Karenia_brevis.AAC.1